MKTGADPIP